MHKVAVIGDYDSIYGFSALGLDTFPVETQEEAAEMLSKLACPSRRSDRSSPV